ncbi:hypothetical protein L6258_00020 [Candidatus Parcubacteria bacterium]|nr:hypothetical protein [Candidatus Parcubacteria bacterium]
MLNFIVHAAIEGGSIEQAAGWSFSNLGNLITAGLQTALIIAGLLSLGFIIYGGIIYITAAGDKMLTEKAMKTLTSAVIGLVIVTGAFAGAKILGNTLGLKIVGPIRWPSVTQAPDPTPPPGQSVCPDGSACREVNLNGRTACVGQWECTSTYGNGWYCETGPQWCNNDSNTDYGYCCPE